MDEHRSRRVSEALREELSEIIGFEMDDPRLAAVDVAAVLLSPDARHATVAVGLGGSEQEKAQALTTLEHARHYLRRELARRLNFRRMPELHFESGAGADIDSRIEILLKRAKKRRGSAENQP